MEEDPENHCEIEKFSPLNQRLKLLRARLWDCGIHRPIFYSQASQLHKSQAAARLACAALSWFLVFDTFSAIL